MDLMDAVHISAAGMRVQTERLKVVAQNIANAESVGTRSGQEPYRRKTIEFKNVLDRETKLNLVQTKRISTDKSQFNKQYEPNNPNADDQGYVLYPNVSSILEMADMREARRGYEANLNIIEASKAMMTQTIGLLK
jgi:flagellar basal-body rod protein FlgC